MGFYFHCCSCSWSWEQTCWSYLSFLLAGVQAAGSGGSFLPSAPAGQLNTSSLEQRCLHFLAHGLAPSTEKAYASGQHKFATSILVWEGHLSVQALLAYLSLWGNVPGPLFLLMNGQPLSRSILTDWLWQIFSAVGIEGNFSSHSFRIGAARVAVCNGIPDHLIQALGHRTSNAHQLCIQTPSEALAGISSQLAWHSESLRLWVPFVIRSAFDIASELSTELSWTCTAVSGVALSVSCLPLVSLLSCFLTQLLQLGAWGYWSRTFRFTPVCWPVLFQAPRRFQLGGGCSPGCHGYLLLKLEYCPALPTL